MEHTDSYYRVPDVQALTGVTRAQLRYWHDSGLVRASGGGGGSPGVPRRYTFEDLVVLRSVVALKAVGCSIQRVRRAWRYLQGHGAFGRGTPLVPAALPLVEALTTGTDLRAAVRAGQMIFVDILEEATRSVPDDPTGVDINRGAFLDHLAHLRQTG